MFAFIVMHLVSWMDWVGSDWRNIIWVNWILIIPGVMFFTVAKSIAVFLKSKLVITIFYIILIKWSVLIIVGVIQLVR